MPLPLLWSFVRRSGKLYVKSGNDVKLKFGPVVGVRPAARKPYCIRIKFRDETNARMLSLNAFSWDENDICGHFQGCGDNNGFMQVWAEHVQPFLDPLSGNFIGPRAPDQDKTTGMIPTASCNSAGQSHSSDVSTPTRKRKSLSDTPPSLLPASKAAKLQVNTKSDSADSTDESTMDASIQKHFVGVYMLPVSSLVEPPEDLLVRDKNMKHVEALKKEIQANPTNDVQPMACIVQMKEEDRFDAKLKEGYLYETIGGNNSREAYQQLLEENPELKKSKVFSHRLCSVYTRMERRLTLRLASKHNRATAFYLETSTWDKINLCQNLLHEHEMPESETHGRPPPGWKKACAATLAQTVEQLDDSMIFYLAALPPDAFDTLRQIYDLHTKAKLKGQTLSHSKKGTAAKPPDLKASNFKCLRGIESSVVGRLLCELKDCKISLRELSGECKSIKQLQKVQVAFVKGTNSISWEAAQMQFPQYTTASQLEPFRKLNFSGPGLPEQFLRFCQRAVATTQREEEGINTKDSDNSFCITLRENTVGIFWKHNIKQVTSEKLGTVLQKFGFQAYPGFSLAIFDLPNGNGVQQEAWAAEDAKQLLLLVRALNYSVSCQNFNVVFMAPLALIGSISEALKAHGDTVQLAVCSFSDKTAGRAQSGVFKQLHETTHAVILVQCGNPPPLSQFAENFFQFEHDAPYITEDTHQPVNPTQKPVAFYTRLVELFTTRNDWVLDGLSGIGSALIASLQMNRSTVAVENSPTQFLYGKLRAVSVLSVAGGEEGDNLPD